MLNIGWKQYWATLIADMRAPANVAQKIMTRDDLIRKLIVDTHCTPTEDKTTLDLRTIYMTQGEYGHQAAEEMKHFLSAHDEMLKVYVDNINKLEDELKKAIPEKYHSNDDTIKTSKAQLAFLEIEQTQDEQALTLEKIKFEIQYENSNKDDFIAFNNARNVQLKNASRTLRNTSQTHVNFESNHNELIDKLKKLIAANDAKNDTEIKNSILLYVDQIKEIKKFLEKKQQKVWSDNIENASFFAESNAVTQCQNKLAETKKDIDTVTLSIKSLVDENYTLLGNTKRDMQFDDKCLNYATPITEALKNDAFSRIKESFKYIVDYSNHKHRKSNNHPGRYINLSPTSTNSQDKEIFRDETIPFPTFENIADAKPGISGYINFKMSTLRERILKPLSRFRISDDDKNTKSLTDQVILGIKKSLAFLVRRVGEVLIVTTGVLQFPFFGLAKISDSISSAISNSRKSDKRTNKNTKKSLPDNQAPLLQNSALSESPNFSSISSVQPNTPSKKPEEKKANAYKPVFSIESNGAAVTIESEKSKSLKTDNFLDIKNIQKMTEKLNDWKFTSHKPDKFGQQHTSVTKVTEEKTLEFTIHSKKITTKDREVETLSAMLSAFQEIHPGRTPKVTCTNLAIAKIMAGVCIERQFPNVKLLVKDANGKENIHTASQLLDKQPQHSIRPNP